MLNHSIYAVFKMPQMATVVSFDCCTVRNFHRKKIYLTLYFLPMYVNKNRACNSVTFYQYTFSNGYAISSDKKEHKFIKISHVNNCSIILIMSPNAIKFLKIKELVILLNCASTKFYITKV